MFSFVLTIEFSLTLTFAYTEPRLIHKKTLENSELKEKKCVDGLKIVFRKTELARAGDVMMI